MPISVQRPPGEPIIILTVSKPIDFATELPPAYEQVADLVQDIDGPIYRVSDFSQMDQSGVSDLVNLLMTALRNRSGSLTDPDLKARTHSVIVGDFKLVNVGVSVLKKQAPDMDISVFRSLDAALDFVRSRIEEAAA